jgi:hypothetical protein
MSNLTKPIATPNNTFANLKTLLKAAGFNGDRVSSLRIFNDDAAVLVYIHATDNGTAAPSTGTDGWPIGSAAGGTGKTFLAEKGSNQEFLDIGTCWIFTASVINIKVLVIGS